MRDNIWLEEKLNKIWQTYFSDVPRENEVIIKFGCKARTRLGSIRSAKSKEYEIKKNINKPRAPRPAPNTLIMITGYFKDETVPEYIIDLTIAHELCHYAHGFSSPLPQLYKYPHQGGLVDKELEKRGLLRELQKQKKWLKLEWPKIIENNFRPKSKRFKVRKRRRKISFLEFLIANC